LADRGAVTITPSGNPQTIPEGYHNGNGTVSAADFTTNIDANGTQKASFTQTSDSTYNVTLESQYPVFGNPVTTKQRFGGFDSGPGDKTTVTSLGGKSESGGPNSTYVLHVSGSASPSGSNDIFGDEDITLTRNGSDYASATVGPITSGSESFTLVDKVSSTPLNTDSKWRIYTSFSNTVFELDVNIDYRIGEYIPFGQSDIVKDVSKN
jgi:hypothetical protein